MLSLSFLTHWAACAAPLGSPDLKELGSRCCTNSMPFGFIGGGLTYSYRGARGYPLTNLTLEPTRIIADLIGQIATRQVLG